MIEHVTGSVYRLHNTLRGDYCSAPSVLPASATDVLTEDVALKEVNLTNKSAATVKVTILDKQETPLPVCYQVEIDAGGLYVMLFGRRLMLGGITWSADAADAIVGYLRWEKA